MASWQFASQGLGVMLGAAVVAGLTRYLTPAAMNSWGWRLPFVGGMLIAPVGIYIRRHLEESLYVFSAKTAGPRESSLRIVCTQHGKTVLAAVLSITGSTTAAYVVTFYMPTYAVRELGLTPAVALLGAALTGLISFAFAPIVGKLSDVVGRKSLILWARIALAALIYPGFLWLNSSPAPVVLYLVLGVFSLGLAMQTVPGITMLPEMFPKAVRASGMSLVYSVGVALFGGFAPLISTWLVSVTGSKLAPAWYLVAMTLVSLMGLPWLRDQTGRDIDAKDAHAPD
jgi:MFS family permease